MHDCCIRVTALSEYFQYGLGLCDSINTVVPAYLGCCNHVCSLSCSLSDVPSFVFSGESCLCFSISLGSDYSSTKHDCQVPLDNNPFQSLLDSSPIRSRIRLLAASD